MPSSQYSKSWRIRDGEILHDGDCHIFGMNICTCGLLHHLEPMADSMDKTLYPSLANDLAKQDIEFDRLCRACQREL